jgi:hypothetical protein
LESLNLAKTFQNTVVANNALTRLQTFLCMFQFEVLISEFLAIDTFASSTISMGEVATLAHEARNDPVERAALESKALLSCA